MILSLKIERKVYFMFKFGGKKKRIILDTGSEYGSFASFLKSSGALGVAIGIAVGQSAVTLIQAIVKNLVTGPLDYFILNHHNDWRVLKIKVPNTNLVMNFGEIFGALFNVIIMAIVSYLLIRILFGKKGVEQVNS